MSTLLSLVLANTGIGDAYRAGWLTNWHGMVLLHLPHSPVHWINDALMAVFFFVAGMEIKRELVNGELSTPQKALLPAAAALGGMLAPALLYLLFSKGTVYQSGWGIPMATDIAFSLGILSLLGNKVPVSLKIFLTALAIIDDLGAIIVIALFYGAAVQWWWLAACVVITAVLYYLLRKKQRLSWLHYLLGLLLWYAMFNSGIHATVAGVVFALLVPVQQLPQLEHKLHYPVHFFILPAFAMANTAIHFPDNIGAAFHSPLSLGIIAGLLLGKPLGICGMSWLLVKKKRAHLPSGTSWKQMTGAGILAGIGFTMSIFISSLAFTDTGLQDTAKIAVLTVSALAMIGGYCWLRWIKR